MLSFCRIGAMRQEKKYTPKTYFIKEKNNEKV